MIKFPCDKEIEYAAIGAMFGSPEAAKYGIENLVDADFYDNTAKNVFSAMRKVWEDEQVADMTLVAAELRSRGMKAAATTLTQFVRLYYLPSHIRKYCQRLKDLTSLRQVITMCMTTIQMAEAEDENTMEFAQQIFSQACRSVSSSGARHAREILPAVLENLEDRFNGVDSLMQTGFHDLDSYLVCLKPADYVIVAGRPSMGKTTFAQNIAENVALKGMPAMVVSLEMSAERLLERSVANIGRIDGQLMRMGHKTLDWENVTNAVAKISKIPFYVDDSSRTLPEIRTSCRKAVTEYGVGIIMIDYIGLIHYNLPGRSREQEVATISRELKGLANELKVPLIAVSQLSRDNTKRTDKTPVLSDLRDSGALEQDADVVLFIHRPEYYGDMGKKGVAQVIIAKQRNGPVGMVELGFDAPRTRFYNIERFRKESKPGGKHNESGDYYWTAD